MDDIFMVTRYDEGRVVKLAALAGKNISFAMMECDGILKTTQTVCLFNVQAIIVRIIDKLELK